MSAQSNKLIGTAAVLLALLTAGCGEVSRDGRAPAQVVIANFEAASGAQPQEFGNVLHSDVVTMVKRQVDGQQVEVPTIFSDLARVTMQLNLRDPGVPGVPSAPSPMNAVTFSRYRVTYRRADGRNTPGVDVPHPFDSAVTFTVPHDGTIRGTFVIVRHTAKEEAPLRALVESPVIISTIAEVTLYGRDQAGNDVAVTGSMGIFFGNFGDPE